MHCWHNVWRILLHDLCRTLLAHHILRCRIFPSCLGMLDGFAKFANVVRGVILLPFPYLQQIVNLAMVFGCILIGRGASKQAHKAGLNFAGHRGVGTVNLGVIKDIVQQIENVKPSSPCRARALLFRGSR